ncbi:MAG TPA: rhamnulokinase family protein [Verrucomicrobiae bacterium]|nr:rhamnulokinase family protein [Verrucomicrobiae bacterium]
MAERVYLGVDLGAESGRVMAGVWNGKCLRLEEVHRFPNGGVFIADSLRWDVVRLWAEIQNGLALAGRKYGRSVVSVGADTWGVDFVLLTKAGELLGLPYHYRDARTQGLLEAAFKIVPRAELYAQTGLQFMELNTLYQLLALRRQHPDLIGAAADFLFMPDFLHFCLSGARVAEYTIASTSQCLHPAKRDWNHELLAKFDLPARIFPSLIQPGTNLGKLRNSVAARTGLPEVSVVAPPAHDTASAVAGVPTANTGKADWAYLSSGTWSLLGVEVAAPVVTPRALELNMTNEGGLDGTIRLLKNIIGLWLIQQCKRSFDAAGRKHDYAELTRMAAASKPLRSLVNPDDPRFLNPADMPRAIQEFCRETGQPVPETDGQIIRCATESLALKYGVVFRQLEELTGNRLAVLHIVGGGSRNDLLNQLTANACGRLVRTGPVEATVMGNILTQVRASGELHSLAEMREVVRASSELGHFEPQHDADWSAAADRFAALVK